MKSWLREPLLHFVLLGAVLFASYAAIAGRISTAPDEIRVTRNEIDRLALGFSRTWQRPPSAEELDGLIRDYVREEAAYREALALGLDKDDLIVRRRLRQKLEFISEDVAAQADPTEDQLRTYLGDHADAFRVERHFTFNQVYLNPQRHADSLKADAAQLLSQLQSQGGEDAGTGRGDALLLGDRFEALPMSDLVKTFGEEFAAKLATLPIDQWQGPIESGYGSHLVFLSRRSEGRLPQLDEVRDAVRRDWVNSQRLEASEKFYQSLLQRFAVTIEAPPQARSVAVAAGG